VTGKWKHYDAKGELVATSRGDVIPDGWDTNGRERLWDSTSFQLDVVPGTDHMQHRMHQGAISGDSQRMDMLTLGGERVYLRYNTGDAFDATGHMLVAVDGGYRADACTWSKAARSAAKEGDVTRLHGQVWDKEQDRCTEGALIPQARAEKVGAMLAAMKPVEDVPADQLEKLALGQLAPDDLARVVAANMAWDIEWPHVDKKFLEVYRTLPGMHG
jgi:hypothetical protein